MIKSILAWLLDLITGRKAAERLGAAEAANAQLREGQTVINNANEAAKQSRKESEDAPFDPDDRADPRNRRGVQPDR